MTALIVQPIVLWIIFFLYAIFSCFVCNVIYGIPIGQIVDVTLALQSFFACIYVMQFLPRFVSAAFLYNGVDFIISILGLMNSAISMLYGAASGYWLYAWLSHTEVASQSFVYNGMVSKVVSTIQGGVGLFALDQKQVMDALFPLGGASNSQIVVALISLVIAAFGGLFLSRNSGA